MPEFETERELLEQIRDLLVPIAGVYRPQYAEVVRNQKKEAIEAILSVVGRGEKKVAAAKLIDGSLTRKEIATASKIDAAELSRLVKALKERDLATEEGGRPKLTVEPAVIWSE